MVENAHLLSDVIPLLDLPLLERVHYIKRDAWIGYPRAQQALMKL